MPKMTVALARFACLAAVVALGALSATAQTPGQPAGRGGPPPPDPKKPQKLEITQGTKARYKVTEELAGVNFPSDAVGTTEAITGVIIVNPDASIGAGSKITVDLKTLTSDQSMRDSYVQRNTLQTDKFPLLELVPKRAVGLPAPMPAGNQAQVGFKLIGDMTLHGVTKEVTWNVIAVLGAQQVGGRATTTIDFAMFNMTKPSLARLVSVEDKITLEIEFRATRSAQ
jgi:polyisoprenoid-binding protein YceI